MTIERNKTIKEMVKSGITLQKIGDMFGISKQRVDQIANKRSSLKKELREEIVYKYDNTCTKCGYKGDDLQIHHIDLNCNNNELDNLVLVCVKCHSFIHKIDNKVLCEYCNTIENKLSPSKKAKKLYGNICNRCYEVKREESKYKVCVRCKEVKKILIRGMCGNCYGNWRYQNVAGEKEKRRKLTYKWREENPERSKVIVTKAIKKYNKKNREKIILGVRERYRKKHNVPVERYRV